MVNEGCRIIEEGVIARASELDVASVLGFNFPSRLSVFYIYLLLKEIYALLLFFLSDCLLSLYVTFPGEV